MAVYAIIAAAGLSSRMKAYKPLLPFGEKPAVCCLLDSLFEGGVSHILLVTGYNRDQLEQECGRYDRVTTLFNPDYARTQMFDSLTLGMSHLPEDADRILIMPVDIPLIRPQTIRQILARKEPFVFPSFHFRKGHPILLDRSLIPFILRYSGEDGMRGAFSSLPCSPVYEVVDDPYILMDMDTPEEYQNLKAMFEKGDTV